MKENPYALGKAGPDYDLPPGTISSFVDLFLVSFIPMALYMTIKGYFDTGIDWQFYSLVIIEVLAVLVSFALLRFLRIIAGVTLLVLILKTFIESAG